MTTLIVIRISDSYNDTFVIDSKTVDSSKASLAFSWLLSLESRRAAAQLNLVISVKAAQTYPLTTSLSLSSLLIA